MKIKNMNDVKKCLGKKVKFQHNSMLVPVIGTIRKGVVNDFEGYEVGIDENTYLVVYDELDIYGCSWCDIDDYCFYNKDIIVFETIE